MKKLLVYTLIGATIGAGVLGFVLMEHNGMGNIPSNCIATLINNGVICSNNPIASAVFHIEALQFFGMAAFSASVISLIGLLIALFAVAGFSGRQFAVSLVPLGPALLSDAPSYMRFRHWLASHELSPPDNTPVH
jgi:hypothetical protein